MARPSFAFTLAGIEPKDRAFRAAGDEVRRAFWRYIKDEGIAVYCRSRELGLDRHGEPLHRLAASTIANRHSDAAPEETDPYAPALIPAHGKSRTEALLKGRGFADHAEWHWTIDPITGLHWGQVLHWHRIGARNLPVRDVIGFSVTEKLELAQKGAAWWSAFRNGQAVAEQAQKMELPIERIKALAGKEPSKFKPTGRTNLNDITFGIGGTREEVQRAIDEGYSTGFSELPRWKPPGSRPKGGGVVAPKPAPKKPVAPAVAAEPAIVHQGVRFVPAYQAERAHETIVVDLNRLHAAMEPDRSYVAPGGGGAAKPGSYEGFTRFLATARQTGTPIEMPRVSLDATGNPVVIDGRHRLAVFAAQGSRFLPVSVPRPDSAAFRQKFGQLAF